MPARIYFIPFDNWWSGNSLFSYSIIEDHNLDYFKFKSLRLPWSPQVSKCLHIEFCSWRCLHCLLFGPHLNWSLLVEDWCLWKIVSLYVCLLCYRLNLIHKTKSYPLMVEPKSQTEPLAPKYFKKNIWRSFAKT